MKNLLTPEEKKYLRFITSKYLAAYHRKSETIVFYYDDKSYIGDAVDVNNEVNDTKYFDNGTIPIPEKLKEIIKKIFIENLDNISDVEEEINTLMIFFIINAEDNSITMMEEFSYLTQRDPDGDYWESDEDEECSNIINELRQEFPNETSLTLKYNGGGDNGYLESEFEEGGQVSVLVENWCYDKLESLHGGWEINEGSNGEFEFDLEDGTISLSHAWFDNDSEENTIYEEKF